MFSVYMYIIAVIIFMNVSFSGTKFSHRRILLFTNNDNPHESNPSLQVDHLYGLILTHSYHTLSLSFPPSLPPYYRDKQKQKLKWGTISITAALYNRSHFLLGFG